MQKSIRPPIVCLFLLLSASFTISATATTAAISPKSAASIKYLVSPKMYVCQDDLPKVVISYKWDTAYRDPKPADDTGLVPLAPLDPVSSGSQAPADLPQPGLVVTTGKIGNIILNNEPVGFGPGTINTHYVPGETGVEVLKSTLTYGAQTNYTQRAFNVMVCRYRLEIAGWAQTGEGDNLTMSWIKAAGNISIGDDGMINGILDSSAGFQLFTENDVEICRLDPEPVGYAGVNVSGHMETPVFGEAYPVIDLAYEPIKGFSAPMDFCVNKVDGTKFTAPSQFKSVDSVNPADYLKTQLSFSGGMEIGGSFGKVGQATYTLIKRW